MKTLLLSIILCISTVGFSFQTKVTVVASFPDAKIYVDDVYKADGKYEFVTELTQFIIRIEKQGYKTEVRKYKYRSLKKSGFLGFERGDPLNVTIILYPENTNNNISTVNNSVDRTQLLTRIETLKSEGLITSDESLELKDKLLNDNGNEHIKAIDELIILRKILNSSFITKEDFSIFKRKVMSKNYDYSKGNSGSDKLDILKIKSESGDYSKVEIDRLKLLLINSYK